MVGRGNVRIAGQRGRLVEVEGVEEALHLAQWARSAGIVAQEIVPAAASVLFVGLADPDQLPTHLERWRPAAEVVDNDLLTIDVTYDGEDLAAVAAEWGTDEAGVIARHQEIEFVSAFCGFAPGFAYLSGLPHELSVRRLDSPRSRVPAGAVAVAGTWCAVYPTASPGGWRLLGHTEATLWDPTRADPVTLAPGTRVRFRAVRSTP